MSYCFMMFWHQKTSNQNPWLVASCIRLMHGPFCISSFMCFPCELVQNIFASPPSAQCSPAPMTCFPKSVVYAQHPKTLAENLAKDTVQENGPAQKRRRVARRKQKGDREIQLLALRKYLAHKGITYPAWMTAHWRPDLMGFRGFPLHCFFCILLLCVQVEKTIKTCRMIGQDRAFYRIQ